MAQIKSAKQITDEWVEQANAEQLRELVAYVSEHCIEGWILIYQHVRRVA